MNTRALDVLRWIDFCSPDRVASARKVCRGRKDIERMRQRLRSGGWAPQLISELTEAAQQGNVQRLLGHDYSVERAQRLRIRGAS